MKHIFIHSRRTSMSKLQSRFGMSHKDERRAIKAGACPGNAEAEYYLKQEGKRAYKTYKRMGNRMRRVKMKFEHADEGYYHMWSRFN